MNLNDVLVGCEGLHHLLLQLSMTIFACCNGIDADSHDNAVTLYHLHGDLTRQTVNLVGRHCIIDVDVQGANLYVWAIVMQYQVEYTVNAIEVGNFFDNLLREFCRNARTQQFVDRRSQHLDACLDNHNGNQCAQDAIEQPK